MPNRIARVELIRFAFETEGLGLPSHGAAGVGNVVARKGSTISSQRWAVRIETEDGARGEYVTHWIGTPASFAQAAMLAPHLVGRNPDTREAIWQDLRREVRAYDHMGHGPLDIALWDLQAKRLGTSVSALIGGYRTRLPTYASTYHGQDEKGGLDTPKAFADYAVACKEQGFSAFKIHGWHGGDAKLEAKNLLGVREAVGDDFPLMIDPASQLRTWLDALYVGHACDEADYLWYEDPYRDTGGAVEGHKRLRERLKTPLLVCEHVRGLEAKAAFLMAGGGDIIHADPEYDMGITGALKIANFCMALGLDVQYHACGPAHRAVMAATPNTRFYEMALVGPDMPNVVPPVYGPDYSDQPDAIGEDGCVPVPDGPGLGVVYDWDFITANATDTLTFGGPG
ncbi:enolase C-terminal domain-like protein [Bauldia litoralis]|uniref:L-alanine-DL-glutamate epimerase n=1 Tax=Bauldia litoralis TaxID=665467 RepID=A0A1G6CS51_9HYPH|nr:enolase C-terminal domain-like protein [Bauldia litoralis]SDB35674.1 L-alanine-DL-glutamate epimerase [Bauldia litoralis]